MFMGRFRFTSKSCLLEILGPKRNININNMHRSYQILKVLQISRGTFTQTYSLAIKPLNSVIQIFPIPICVTIPA